MPFTIKTQSAVLPVTVENVMSHAVVEDENQYSLIERYIKAVSLHGQQLTGRRFTETTFVLDLESFPSGKIELRPDLQSVTSVKYTDEDDQEQTLDSDLYYVKTTPLIGYIIPVEDEMWPLDAKDILIEFVAGYPIDDSTETRPISTTPEDIQLWISVKVAGFIEQREDFLLSKGGNFGIATMPRDFSDSLLDSYIVPGIGSAI